MINGVCAGCVSWRECSSLFSLLEINCVVCARVCARASSRNGMACSWYLLRRDTIRSTSFSSTAVGLNTIHVLVFVFRGKISCYVCSWKFAFSPFFLSIIPIHRSHILFNMSTCTRNAFGIIVLLAVVVKLSVSDCYVGTRISYKCPNSLAQNWTTMK